jgi:hypothetical protein
MRTRLGLLTATLALTFGAAPQQALAGPQDVAATHAYIEANYTLAKATVARIAPAQKKILALNKKLASECPNVGVGSPENEASQPIAHEVAVALWSISYGLGAAPVHRFQQAVGRLRWSNPATTRAVARYVRNLHDLASVPLPDLCGDVRAWVATGFQVIPAGVVTLVERVEGIVLKSIPSRLLAPYERGGDAAMLKRTARLEQKIEEFEFLVGQGDWIRVLETLGLQE